MRFCHQRNKYIKVINKAYQLNVVYSCAAGGELTRNFEKPLGHIEKLKTVVGRGEKEKRKEEELSMIKMYL